MKETQLNRRQFIRDTVTTAAGLAVLSAFPQPALSAAAPLTGVPAILSPGSSAAAPRIKFSVIGINHGHIYGQIEAVVRGGGQLVACYAKEPDLAAAFAKRFPQAKMARSEAEILEDNSIQLILSAAIPDERAPIGVRAMRAGKGVASKAPRRRR